MTWSKEYEFIVPSVSTALGRRQAYGDLFQYHHETFLPAHNVTTTVDTWKYSTYVNYDTRTYRCKRTITPSGRPNIPVYEKAWAHSLQWRTDSSTTVSDSFLKWDGTDNPMPSSGTNYNDYFQLIYSGASTAPRAVPSSGETRYKYYVSSEDSNTWMLFCNGTLIGYEFGDDTWWREVDPNFYTTGIITIKAPGMYMPSMNPSSVPWYYEGSVTQNILYGLPMYTNTYSPMVSPTNFLITDNIYLFVNQYRTSSSGTGTSSSPYLIGKNQRTDILLKCRNTTSMQANLSTSGAESIFYNGKYYIDVNPTSATSLLLETAADEGTI